MYNFSFLRFNGVNQISVEKKIFVGHIRSRFNWNNGILEEIPHKKLYNYFSNSFSFQ